MNEKVKCWIRTIEAEREKNTYYERTEGAVLDDLSADDGISEEGPKGGSDCASVNCSEDDQG